MKNVMMFTSPICSGCKTMYPVIKEMGIRSHCVTEEPGLVSQFRIMGGLPVFIKTDDQGNFLDRLDGVQSKSKLEAWAAG